jgi:hypothetical protein
MIFTIGNLGVFLIHTNNHYVFAYTQAFYSKAVLNILYECKTEQVKNKAGSFESTG